MDAAKRDLVRRRANNRCNYCNLHKSSNLTGIDPQTGQIARLFHPRTDRWEQHFAFDGGAHRWPHCDWPSCRPRAEHE